MGFVAANDGNISCKVDPNVLWTTPTGATSFAIAGISLDKAILPEAVVQLGSVPTARYATTGTQKVPEFIAPFVKTQNGVLLANHGALNGEKIYLKFAKLPE